MANTTNFGWETPDDTDLVKDGAAAMRTLGNAIDTSFVDLKGGTTGQVLSKTSNTDMDFTWINNDQGDITAVTAGTGLTGGGTSGAVTLTNDMATTITASGDIVVGTGSGTYDNLPIGATGQVLTADTTVSPYKVKWAAAASTPTFVGCSAISTSGTSTSNNTFTIVALQSEYFDTDSFHNNSTNNSRITIPSGKGGYYLILARSGFEGGNSTVDLRLYKNGAVLDDGYVNSVTQKSATPYIPGDLRTQAIVNLTAGDYIEMGVRQATGGSQDTWGENRLTVQFLGA